MRGFARRKARALPKNELAQLAQALYTYLVAEHGVNVPGDEGVVLPDGTVVEKIEFPEDVEKRLREAFGEEWGAWTRGLLAAVEYRRGPGTLEVTAYAPPTEAQANILRDLHDEGGLITIQVVKPNMEGKWIEEKTINENDIEKALREWEKTYTMI